MKNLADFVKVYDDVFNEEECKFLIKEYDNLSPKATPFMRHSDYTWENDYRSFMELDLCHQPEFKEFIPSYYDRVHKVYDHYKSVVKSPYFPEKYGLEDARMKKYEANNHDQFGWHTDVGDYASARRYLVMFTYLNDVEEGGETEFESDFEFTIKPIRGRMVVFPPMWMFPHRGKQPISGSKYILSTYLHYV